MIQAVIWDIDGTLIDSEPLHLEALLAVCDRHRVDISDLSDDHFIGVNLFGVWNALRERFPSTLTVQSWVGELNTIYAAGVAKLVPIPDSLMVVRSLAERGIRQAAVSNSNRVVVDTNLSTLGITDILEFSLSVDDVVNGKPAPELYLKALKQLKLRPAHACAVEDSKTGVVSAKAAGIKVFGFGDPHLSADLQIANLADILPYFEAV